VLYSKFVFRHYFNCNLNLSDSDGNFFLGLIILGSHLFVYMKVCLVSRDYRTFKLFRKTWLCALSDLNWNVLTYNRKEDGNFLLFLLKMFFVKKIIFGTSEILLMSLLSRRRDVWVFTGMGRLLDGSKPFVSKSILFYLRCIYRGQRVIVLNLDDYRQMFRVFGSNVFKLSGEGYYFKGPVISLNHSSNKLSNGVINFAYVGRLLNSKGVDTLLSVFKEVSNIHGVRLHLFGDFDFGNSDSVDISPYEEISSITFHGFVDDLSMYLSRVDCVISLSHREGLPFSILDALNFGCSVILSDVPGHREFKNYDGIYFCETRDDLVRMLTEANYLFRRLSLDRMNIRNDALSLQFGIEIISKEIVGILSND
jgi:glycosyltransferase involved in cell wall biosynthesis